MPLPIDSRPAPAATIVVVTKNRKDELRDALRSAFAQRCPVEVLVIDDGSDDGTSELVASEFPEARLYRFEVSEGLVVQRNRAARFATAPVVVSIDDDAVFSSDEVVPATIRDFDDPRIAVVAVPLVDLACGPEETQRAPAADGVYVTATFRGGAYAIRRVVFLALGGFREEIFHQGEEADFSLRLLDAGYVTRLGRSDPIRHFGSPIRDLRRMDVYAHRNELLWVWWNFPFPWHLVYLLGYTVKGVVFGVRVGRPLAMLEGVVRGYGACLAQARRRRPVSRAAFDLDRRLRRKGPLPLAVVERGLSPVRIGLRVQSRSAAAGAGPE